MLHPVNEPAAVVAVTPAVVEVPATAPVSALPSSSAPKPSCGRGNHTRPQVPPAGLLDIPDALLRLSHVLALVGVSDNTLSLRIKRGDFPRADMKSGRSPLWRVATIRDWLNGSVVQQLERRLAEVQKQLSHAPAHELAELMRERKRLSYRLRCIRLSKPAPSHCLTKGSSCL